MAAGFRSGKKMCSRKFKLMLPFVFLGFPAFVLAQFASSPASAAPATQA
jgi:hypothetical protein